MIKKIIYSSAVINKLLPYKNTAHQQISQEKTDSIFDKKVKEQFHS